MQQTEVKIAQISCCYARFNNYVITYKATDSHTLLRYMEMISYITTTKYTEQLKI